MFEKVEILVWTPYHAWAMPETKKKYYFTVECKNNKIGSQAFKNFLFYQNIIGTLKWGEVDKQGKVNRN